MLKKQTKHVGVIVFLGISTVVGYVCQEWLSNTISRAYGNLFGNRHSKGKNDKDTHGKWDSFVLYILRYIYKIILTTPVSNFQPLVTGSIHFTPGLKKKAI